MKPQALILTLLAGCATAPVQEDPRITELNAEWKVLKLEMDVLEDRQNVLFLCKKLTHYRNWDKCYELAGLER